eukprot:NODE_185_length_2774_cov_26.496789_g171_i0.p1 GENE.NODE_185_length_2774_cov_26.496789_g171_i0~~NODE_185_length_2774_cov_26.496789_g171_i0.p1  ORF type:complete len:879 (-),score=238.93 NODE_185_length_2774_cov_26.496789_g171_i0:136-2607(-)
MFCEQSFLEKNAVLAPLENVLKATRHVSGGAESPKEASNPSVPLQDEPAVDEGPVIELPIRPRTLEQLLEYYSHKQEVMHPMHLIRLLKQAHGIIGQRAQLQEIQLVANLHKQLIIVGDLHGQLADLLLIFQTHGLPSEQRQYLFNGDFVDRGKHGVEVMAILLCALVAHPDSVYLNRGNHESSDVNVCYGFAEEIQTKYPGQSQGVFDLFQLFWMELPIASLINRQVLVVHGGLFRYDGVLLEHLRNIHSNKTIPLNPSNYEDCLLFDLLWSDPQDKKGRSKGDRGASSIKFGADVTDRFLLSNSLSLIVRSHEVAPNGYKLHHKGKLATVFSASNYSGKSGNRGAVMILKPDMQYNFHTFWAPPLADFKTAKGSKGLVKQLPEIKKNAKEDMVKQIKSTVYEHQQELYWYFANCDRRGLGRVTVPEWRQGLTDVLGLTIPLQLYQEDLITLDEKGLVNYPAFLDEYKITVDPKHAQWQFGTLKRVHDGLLSADLALRDMLRFFDLDGDGTVDVVELDRALSGMGLGLSRGQVRELLRGISRDSKGHVDVVAFLDSLQIKFTGKNCNPATKDTLDQLAKIVFRKRDRLLDSFISFDQNDDGRLQYNEFVSAMSKLLADDAIQVSNDILLQVAKDIDANQSGAIDYIEFLDAFKTETGPKPLQNVIQHICCTLYQYRHSLRKAFNSLDVNGDGYLSREELRNGLLALNSLVNDPHSLTFEDIDALVDYMDYDQDGKVDWREFVNAFQLVPADQLQPLTRRTSLPPVHHPSAIYSDQNESEEEAPERPPLEAPSSNPGGSNLEDIRLITSPPKRSQGMWGAPAL